jgi:predicted AAA+ superfamily ATPase
MSTIDPRFLYHNTHLEDPNRFAELDPQLRLLEHQKYVYHAPLLNELPKEISGIYTLGGGRQIGKSTLLKQWMLKLIQDGIKPKNIIFISGELIDDHHALLNILIRIIESMPQEGMHYLLLDEITYIKNWDKAIKYAADSGLLNNTVLILTGSDLSLMHEAKLRFPGRRGQSDIINFHLYPLSFKETVLLKHPDLNHNVEEHIDVLFACLEEYLIHGGFLTAINELAMHHRISNATLNIYAEWIRGDMIKRGKQEHYLREILSAILKRYNSQITWNALAQDLSIDHPKTVADYCSQLVSMDALFIQEALLENKLSAAPKKAKKLIFNDPFIFHAIRAWIWPEKNSYESQIQPLLKNPEFSSGLVEAMVVNHYHRFYPTYYIKAEGEVDVAYVSNYRFWPIEVKWTNQLREKDLKQILKYHNGKILAKVKQPSMIQGLPVESLPLTLFNLS